MTVRYLGNEKDGYVEIGAAHKYKVGDIVFVATSGGDAMFIGRLKDSPEDLVLIVGRQAVPTWEKYCAPAGRGFPAEGASWRRAYLKEHPGSLV